MVNEFLRCQMIGPTSAQNRTEKIIFWIDWEQLLQTTFRILIFEPTHRIGCINSLTKTQIQI